MTVTVEWDDAPKTIIRYTFSKGWRWDEFIDAINQSNAMIETVDHVVDIISDVQEHDSPGGGLPKSRMFASIKHPREGIIVVVRATPLMEMFRNVIRDASPHRTEYEKFHFVESLDDARAYIWAAREAKCD
jgi:hypothetical protein